MSDDTKNGPSRQRRQYYYFYGSTTADVVVDDRTTRAEARSPNEHDPLVVEALVPTNTGDELPRKYDPDFQQLLVSNADGSELVSLPEYRNRSRQNRRRPRCFRLIDSHVALLAGGAAILLLFVTLLIAPEAIMVFSEVDRQAYKDPVSNTIMPRPSTEAPVLRFCLFLATSLVAAKISVGKQRGATVFDEFYPALHIRPPQNWINDPNGPFRDPNTGIAHLWMQYNPYGPTWGNMSWYHVTSRDLVYWYRVGVSLKYKHNGVDDAYNDLGIFSGSVTIVSGVPVISYTCASYNPGQRQCLAWPVNNSDPLLLDWSEDPENPILPSPPKGMSRNNFRDPTTAWTDEDSDTPEWLMAVGTSIAYNSTYGVNRSSARVAVYSSPIENDFRKWKFSNYMYQNDWEPSGMFECPDFYTVAVNATTNIAVLKTSNEYDRLDYYRLGSYNSRTRQFQDLVDTASGTLTSEDYSPTMLDYGTFYASKTYYDTTLQKRILWGWVNEDDTHFAERGWAGVQTLPRVVEYSTEAKKLKMSPYSGLQALRFKALVNKTYPVPITEQFSEVPLIPYSGRLGSDRSVPLNASEVKTIEPIGQHLQQEIIANFAFDSALMSRNNGCKIGLKIRQASATKYTSVYVTSFVDGGKTLTDVNFVGGDFIAYPMSATKTTVENAANCSNICATDRRCVAWTYLKSEIVPNWTPSNPWNFTPRCSLKSVLTQSMITPSGNCVSGAVSAPLVVVNRTLSGTSGSTNVQMGRAFLRNGTAVATKMLQLHVFNDHSVTEVYKDEGLESITSRLYVKGNTAGAAAFASSECYAAGATTAPSISLVNASAWALKSIWIEQW